MQLLKQSTSVTIKLGPFLDDTDGKTAETGLTISQSDVLLSKNGGSFAQKNDTNSATHDTAGWYSCALNATDTGTLGRLIVAVHESGALPVWREFMVVPANAHDSLVGGSDYLQADVAQVSGDATAADNLEADYDGTGYNKSASTIGTVTSLASGAIDAAAVLAEAANKIADHVLRRAFGNAADSSDGDTLSFRSLLGAIAKMVNKVSIAGTTLTVYEEDDATPLGTQEVTSTAGAAPITALDTN